MDRSDLRAPRILVDGSPLHGVHTQVGRLGGHQLSFITTISCLGLDVESVFLGHRDAGTAVSHLVVSLGDSRIEVAHQPDRDLAATSARSACLLDHLAHVRRAVCDSSGAVVSVDIDDDALLAAAR